MTSDSTTSISTLALKPVERLINRGIGLSSTAGAMAAALAGRSLDIQLEGTHIVLQLKARAGSVQLTAGDKVPGTVATDSGVADATVAGSPLAMLRMLGGDPQALIRDGDIRMTGNTDVANQFRDLLHMARPDLEDELAKLVGDPLAHRFGVMGREFVDWGRRTVDSVSRSVGEYLTEERRTLPTRIEAQEFYREVDTLVNDVERAEARLDGLLSRLTPPGTDA
ncbi:MAG: SCP2 sterol-binding domain-containing protein [Gammaproteobacteria bacterium]